MEEGEEAEPEDVALLLQMAAVEMAKVVAEEGAEHEAAGTMLTSEEGEAEVAEVAVVEGKC